MHYSIQHGSSRPIKKTKTVTLSREELELRPEATGEFTYQFISIDDANYKDIEIGRTVKQTVHPLAGVAFSNAGKGQKVWSCEGDEIQVPIELKVGVFLQVTYIRVKINVGYYFDRASLHGELTIASLARKTLSMLRISAILSIL